MNNDIILKVIELAVMILSFLVGRYIVPKFKSADLTTLKWLSEWAYKFVLTAETLMSDKSGEEKKKTVTEQITAVCEANGLNITNDQVSALIEEAVSSLKSGESK